jgi:uncharacterized coiled-coil protein SlyX
MSKNKLTRLPVPFDTLADAVKEVTGGIRVEFSPDQYKGHQPVPFMNFTSLSRVVEMFRNRESLRVINAVLSRRLGIALKHIITVTEEREFWRERVEGAEKEREEFRRRFNLERSCLEDADKRIAALDMRNAELNSTIERWATDRAESAQVIAELEAKLATPVRLPAYRNSPDMHTKQYYEAIGFNQAIDACEVSVSGAGFTVEGE